VYVAPPKVAVSDDLPPGEHRRMWSPTASTLIYGARDAVLVDPLMTKEESRTLAEWVVATGKNVLTIWSAVVRRILEPALPGQMDNVASASCN
jgi:hypothetical protein